MPCRRARRNAAVANLAVVLLLVAPVSLRADVVVTPAEALSATTLLELFIEDGEIRVEVETGVPDLVVFEGGFPDDFRVRMGLESEPDEVRLPRFFSEDFVIRADGGRPLAGEVASFETRRRIPRDNVTGEALTTRGTAGRPVVFTVFRYCLEGRPETLTLTPPTTGGGSAEATIVFRTYHLGLPVMDFHPLEGEETIDLDWYDPWNSAFRNPELSRQYESPMNVFLYVEPFEVRVEIIARARDVQEWTDVGIDDRATIPVVIREDVTRRTAAFFADALELTIDGEPVTPVVHRVDFLDPMLRTSAVIDPTRELDAASATLGVILVATGSGYPQEAALTWSLFTDRVEKVAGAVTDGTGSMQVVLQRDDNVLQWTRDPETPAAPALVDVGSPPSMVVRVAVWISWLGVAVLGYLLVRGGARAAGGAGSWARFVLVAVMFVGVGALSWYATEASTVDDARAAEIVSALLHNLYRAFDHREEQAIRATLERSVSSDQLTETFLAAGRAVELAGQWGARSLVLSVELAEATPEDADTGFRTRCRWTVTTTVGRWGRIHTLEHGYVADVLVEPVDGSWKITELELIDEHRL